MLRLSGLQTLLHAAHLFPEDRELSALASVESAFPTLSVRAQDEAGNEIGAEVYSREIDVFTSGLGEKQFLGRAPLPPTPILPGYYRVVVAFDAGGFRELVCNPGPAFMQVELVARRRGDEDAITGGMVPIPAVEFAFPEFEGERCFQGLTVSLDSYWVDATEVSNAQYQRFLESTGRPPPPLWRRPPLSIGAFLERYGELPVTTVTWTDAVAYAEWMGKRLPTAGEWHRAAGGPAGWPFPYSPDPGAPPRGNVLAPDETVRTREERFEQYLRYAAPVRSHDDARTPEGLYHMYGNVTELTESMAVTLVDEATLRPRPFDRFAFGQPWNAQAWGNGMRCPDYMGIGPNYPTEFIGFRCAKSAAP